MTPGYAGREELNREAFRDGLFASGDRGRVDEEGRLFITGREKLLIDVRGDKVDPIEVEDVLAVHPKVDQVVVVGVASEVEGEELVKAVVVPAGECGERELIRYCRERLADYKVPAARGVPRRDPAERGRQGAPQVPHRLTSSTGRAAAAPRPSATARGGSTAAACAARRTRAPPPSSARSRGAGRSPCTCSRARCAAAPRARAA